MSRISFGTKITLSIVTIFVTVIFFSFIGRELGITNVGYGSGKLTAAEQKLCQLTVQEKNVKDFERRSLARCTTQAGEKFYSSSYLSFGFGGPTVYLSDSGESIGNHMWQDYEAYIDENGHPSNEFCELHGKSCPPIECSQVLCAKQGKSYKN